MFRALSCGKMTPYENFPGPSFRMLRRKRFKISEMGMKPVYPFYRTEFLLVQYCLAKCLPFFSQKNILLQLLFSRNNDYASLNFKLVELYLWNIDIYQVDHSGSLRSQMVCKTML